jgi:two-component system chemotaxis response regulator CheY
MRALVIDDSRATRAILARILQQLGYEVRQAADGRAGIAELGAPGEVDLALVDWNMPVMDGLTFIETVRSRPDHDDLTIVMVTTEGDADHMLRALEAGANEYVMKPFTAGVIRDKLELLGVPTGVR